MQDGAAGHGAGPKGWRKVQRICWTGIEHEAVARKVICNRAEPGRIWTRRRLQGKKEAGRRSLELQLLGASSQDSDARRHINLRVSSDRMPQRPLVAVDSC